MGLLSKKSSKLAQHTELDYTGIHPIPPGEEDKRLTPQIILCSAKGH